MTTRPAAQVATTDTGTSSAYKPWPKWKRRYIHARWWLADKIDTLAHIIAGDF